MTHPLSHLKPKLLWDRFNEIRQIPRKSKNEQRIRQYVLDFAAQHDCESKVDAAGNVVVYVPASSGCEAAPTVVLQAHLDMVCQKNADKVFDFATDAIELVLEGDTLRADGTTLGADNGVGVAAAMALITDDSVTHGPLELLFTIDEETGLTGAQALDASLISGSTLINLDSEDDGVVTIGCAGGRGTTITMPLHRAEATGQRVQVSVSGLSGGHSGVDIHHNRANAVKVLAEALASLEGTLVSIKGGNAHNAIPREASAVVVADHDAVQAAISELQSKFAERYRKTDPELLIHVEAIENDGTAALSQETSQGLISLLNELPHGVIGMSADFPGLVETSNTVAILTTDSQQASIVSSARSSSAEALDAIVERLHQISKSHGATPVSGEGYPGWAPNAQSKLLAVAVDVYASLYGEKPTVESIHAGLECGILGERNPGMDMISIGPTIRNPHSPSEEVSVSSVSKMLGEYLGGILAKLTEAS